MAAMRIKRPPPFHLFTDGVAPNPLAHGITHVCRLLHHAGTTRCAVAQVGHGLRVGSHSVEGHTRWRYVAPARVDLASRSAFMPVIEPRPWSIHYLRPLQLRWVAGVDVGFARARVSVPTILPLLSISDSWPVSVVLPPMVVCTALIALRVVCCSS